MENCISKEIWRIDKKIGDKIIGIIVIDKKIGDRIIGIIVKVMTQKSPVDDENIYNLSIYKDYTKIGYFAFTKFNELGDFIFDFKDKIEKFEDNNVQNLLQTLKDNYDKGNYSISF